MPKAKNRVQGRGVMSETTLQKVEAEVQKLTAELQSVEQAQVSPPGGQPPSSQPTPCFHVQLFIASSLICRFVFKRRN